LFWQISICILVPFDQQLSVPVACTTDVTQLFLNYKFFNVFVKRKFIGYNML